MAVVLAEAADLLLELADHVAESDDLLREGDEVGDVAAEYHRREATTRRVADNNSSTDALDSPNEGLGRRAPGGANLGPAIAGAAR